MKTDGLAVSQPSVTQKESKISSSYVIASVILSITLRTSSAYVVGILQVLSLYACVSIT